ncbi:MAG: PQQ-binding-like beta-propeller repeat protein [Armatimonadia bacterium]
MRLTLRIVSALLLLAAIPTFAADWPLWRCDARHSAATSQDLGGDLHLQWTLQLPPLKPAWPDEPRMRFDVAYEPIVAGQTLFVASPREDALLALDTRTARLRWRFLADGPIRLAPAVSNGRVYFGSDDGNLYCLNAADGALVWKFRAASEERLVLGNERIISTWPVRGAPVVDKGRVYFAAGIWPFMGVFLYCLDATTGSVIWRKDDTGAVYFNQPHNSPAFSGVAPQGYLTATDKVLLIPGGRSTPAGVNPDTGELLFFKLAENHKIGDSKVAANGTWFLNCGNLYQLTTGTLLGGVSSRPVTDPYVPFVSNPTLRINPDSSASVVTDDLLCGIDKGEVVVRSTAQAKMEESTDSKGAKSTNLVVPVSTTTGIEADRVWVSAAGKLVASAGNRLLLIAPGDAATESRTLWQAEVPGTIESVIAADGRLFVSTLEGEIHCFGQDAVQAQTVKLRRDSAPRPGAAGSALARRILRATGAKEGYCLVLGAKDADLLAALARDTQLRVVALAPDRKTAEVLRDALWDTGLYGPQVAVLPGNLGQLRLPPYFANLVVAAEDSNTALAADPSLLQLAFASVRPYGGAMVLGLDAARYAALRGLLGTAGFEGAEAEQSEDLVVVRKPGALPGSANWTHQYGNPANTVSSRDSTVEAPLGLLWFGGPSNLDVLPRHGHGPPEQVVDGRLFIEGPDSLRANDVYTGRQLWKVSLPELGEYYNRTYHQPGANALGTNFVATPETVYVVHENRCLKLDPATGERQGEIVLPTEGDTPDKTTGWGYIAVQGDVIVAGASPMFWGGKGKPGDSDNWDATSSRRIIVLDRASGKPLWQVEAKCAFRHNAICVSPNLLFCIDRLPDPILQTMQRRGEEPVSKPSLLALDLHTGRLVWRADADVFGTWLSYSVERDILLQSGRPSRDMLTDEPGDRMVAFRGTTGEVLWEMKEKYYGPPIILGDRILTQTISLGQPGRALSLLTGKPLLRTNPITGEQTPWQYGRNYGCNTVIASENLITFRSAAAGFFDLRTDGGTGNLGGFKSGCTSNLIVANGVLNAPDYTRTCTCSYQNQTSLAFVHDPSVEAWSFNLMDLGDAPIKRVGLNFGAPGDRLAPDGALWLDCPSVGGPSPKVEVTLTPATPAQFRHHASWVKAGDLPWVAASGLLGVEKVSVRLAPAGSPVRSFTLRLHFVEPEEAAAGQRLFDVAVQGQPVCRRLDIAAEASGSARSLVKEVRGVKASETLEVALTACPDSHLSQTVLCGLEIVEE